MNHLSVRPAGASGSLAAAPPAKKNVAVETQSFADQLSLTFTQSRAKFGINPNNMKLPVDGTSRHAIVVGQNPVTARTSSSPPARGLNALVPKAANAVTPPPPSAPKATDTVQSADDLYWAKQPGAVQQLRKIDDSYQRAALGAQLASEGYSIDTPVMVWGWDPAKTTELRQSFGYTWVPSAMQSPVTAAPGITGAGITPYDPTHPPAGSISV